MASPTDTSPEAARVLAEVYRSMPPARKWALLEDAQRTARALHAAGVRRDRPGVTAREVRAGWLAAALSLQVDPIPGGPSPLDTPTENLAVVREVARAFDALGIAYALGGSLASSIYGTPRYTLDADLTAEPFPDRVDRLVASFGPAYHLSAPAIHEAIRARSSFHIIQAEVGFKVNVFIRRDRDFEHSLMQRRAPLAVLPEPEPPIQVVSAEDIVLLKLEWYRLGQEASDRQWSDVLGVLSARAGRLDLAYLELWAGRLGVADLLERARRESLP